MTALGQIPADTDLQLSNDVWPAGAMAWWPGTAATVPAGWKVLDGSAATGALASVVGANVPNFAGRAPIGVDTTYISLLGTRGSILHHHSSAGLSGASHSHSAGTLYAESHGHNHSFSMNSHTHTVPGALSSTVIIGSSSGGAHYVNWLATGNTGGGNGGVGGSIQGSGNLGLSGSSDPTDPGFQGQTGDASPPHQVGYWIVKT